jgi:heat shock protein HslJ
LKAVCIAAALLLAGCSNADSSAASAGVPDGEWRVTEIDARAVKNGRMTLVIKDGILVGGHDGCNAWGFMMHEGKRVAMSNAMACPGDADTAAYAVIQNGKPGATALSLTGTRLSAVSGGRRFTAAR